MVRIVEPSAKLLWITPEPLQAIEHAARTCYKSEDQITDESADRMVRSLIQRGHEAMLEHAVASIKFVTDRGVSHELVRHRLAAYAQESTRYCNYGREKFGKEITVIRPPLGEDPMTVGIWQTAMIAAEAGYQFLLLRGVKPQVARSVLPTCTKTEIVTTANLREWRHIFKMRLAKDAHPQIREIMACAWLILSTAVPVVFDQYADLAKEVAYANHLPD
jgi:thymidylate synthase (FAD)